MIVLKFVGTDAYLMDRFMPYMGFKWKIKTILNRIFHKILDRFVSEIIVADMFLSTHLVRAGFKSKIREVRDSVKYSKPIDKIKHNGFNVVYYDTTEFKKNKKTIRWLYGLDIIDELKEMFPNVNWIKLDGTSNMVEIYSIADFYLRPNRNDGASRMIQECKINKIPYYHSQSNPDISKIVKQLSNEINKSKN